MKENPGKNIGPTADETPAWIPSAACILLLGAAVAYFYRGVWNPINTIDGLDSSLWVPMFVQKWTRYLFVPRWTPHYLAGIAQQIQFLSHDLLLSITLPPHRFHGFQFMLDTFLAGAFMFAFLRSQRLGRFGSLVGALSYQLGNNLLTTASLGGMWKFATACWVPLFFLFFCRVVDGAPKRLKNSIFAGATLGMQFLGGEIQLAYYVCLLALAYFAVEAMANLWNSRRAQAFPEQLKAEGKRMLWGALCAVLGLVFAAEVFCTYASFARDNENVGVATAEENWEFVTEFSFPPEETLALALSAGVFETDAYPQEYQGHEIKRISDDYMGMAVLMFAFVALFSGNRKVWFFAAAAVFALIVSYGQHFPHLFRLIYALPIMKGLRVPHKWLFISAFCVPILAGMGADFWRKAPPEKSRRITCSVFVFFAAMITLACFSPAILGLSSRGLRPEVLARVSMLALVSAVCALGRIKRISGAKTLYTGALLIIVLALAADLIGNASKFVKYYDHRPLFKEDYFVRSLLNEAEPFRVKLWSENPHLRKVVTEALPYNGVGVVDVIMSRRPPRYSEVFRASRDGSLPYKKLFQLFNVKYVLSAVAVPDTAGIALSPAGVVSAAPDEVPPGEGYIYEMRDYLPRVYMVNKYVVLEREKIIDVMGGPDFDLRRTVALEKQPDFAGADEAGALQWKVEDFSRAPHMVEMRVTTDRPGILVLQDFNAANWRALIDSEEAEILQANYLMRGVVVPEGEHRVVFTYHPPVWGFAVTLFSWVAVIALAVYSLASRALAALKGARADML